MSNLENPHSGTSNLIKISPSSLACFDTCPHRYRCTYLEGKKDKQHISAFIGTCVHEVLDFAAKTPTLSQSSAQAMFTEKFAEAKKLGVDIPDEAILSQENAAGVLMVTRGYKHIRRYPSDKTEQKMTFVEPRTGVVVTGVIDRIAPDFTIQDWKTGKTIPSIKKLKLSWQTRVYTQMLCQKTVGLKEVNMDYIFLRHDITLSVRMREDDISDAKNKLAKAIKSIQRAQKEGVFETKPSGLCVTCSQNGLCGASYSKPKPEVKESLQLDLI